MTGGAAIPVSVVVMTRNEAANISACLASVDAFGEVFVVDSDSSDGTAGLAAGLGARVVRFRWDGRYPKKKQWCLDRLPFGYDWVLFLDADERVTPALSAEIRALTGGRPDHAGYFIDATMAFLGRRLRFGHRNRKLALLDRRRAWFPPCPDLDVATMWEVEGHYQPRLDGSAGRLAAVMHHEDAKPPFAWFERHNRYSDWEAALRHDGRWRQLALAESGRRRWLKLLVGWLPARPLAAFIHSYVWRLGFLDGAAGFHYAVARAFYYWQIAAKVAALTPACPPTRRPAPSAARTPADARRPH
jgi:glycosyltransferase involved in cell wall biosynthesis